MLRAAQLDPLTFRGDHELSAVGAEFAALYPPGVRGFALAGEQRLDDPEEIALIIRAFEALRDAGVTGDPGVALIQRVAAELRR